MPNNVITLIGNTPSARALADRMGINMNLPVADIAIRYGWRTAGQYRHEINNKEALELNANKYSANQTLKCHNINVPKQSTNINDLDRSKVIFARKFRHSKGSDIIVLQPNRINRRPRDFYTEYIPNILKEYRCHVIGDKVVSSSIKVLEEGRTVNLQRINGYVKNENTGYVHKLCVCPQNVKDYAIKAVKALGLDFGAVDLAVTDTDSTLIYVFEVNTAPGLIDRRLDIYAQKLLNMCNNLIAQDMDAEAARCEQARIRIEEERVAETARMEAAREAEVARLAAEEFRRRAMIISNLVEKLYMNCSTSNVALSFIDFIHMNHITIDEWIDLYHRINRMERRDLG